jgi:adenosyl cobinamide kinase/adenosyl cobinamide phosphate guanylyltransferase
VSNPQSKTGTAEWAEQTINVAKGCRHGCLYCYARAEKLRFGQIQSGAEWMTESVYQDRVDKGYRKRPGRIMLPSAHDITPATCEAVATVASKLLEAGNELVIVTKGDGPSLQAVADKLHLCTGARERVLWRVTIGCLEDRCRQFWEPHAPTIDMRLEVLRWLRKEGWQTSVSCEPLLEPRRAVALVTTVAPFVSETIWIGTCRELRARTAWCRQARAAYLETAIRNLEEWQTPAKILTVADDLCLGLPPAAWEKVRFKDSYSSVLIEAGRNIEDGKALQ